MSHFTSEMYAYTYRQLLHLRADGDSCWRECSCVTATHSKWAAKFTDMHSCTTWL